MTEYTRIDSGSTSLPPGLIHRERITIGDHLSAPPIPPAAMGWICPRCQASNAPSNTTCAQCSPHQYKFRLWNDGTTSEIG